jgi:hypothetical protein
MSIHLRLPRSLRSVGIFLLNRDRSLPRISDLLRISSKGHELELGKVSNTGQLAMEVAYNADLHWIWKV